MTRWRLRNGSTIPLALLWRACMHRYCTSSGVTRLSVLQCIESADTLAAEKRIALSLDPRVLRGWALLAPDGIEAAIASYRAALPDPTQGTIQYAPYSFALFFFVARETTPAERKP